MTRRRPGRWPLLALGMAAALAAGTASGVGYLGGSTGTTSLAATTDVTTDSLVGRASGLCVDVPQGVRTSGTRVQLWACNSGFNQHWVATAANELRVYRYDCLTPRAGSKLIGAGVVIEPCNGSLSQKWRLNANASITSLADGLCLDAVDAKNRAGTLLQQWPCHGRSNQSWITKGLDVVKAPPGRPTGGPVVPTTAGVTVNIDNATQKQSGFDGGTSGPFHTCTTLSPNGSAVETVQGTKALKIFWTQTGYNGTRMRRGSELCSALSFQKEGWYAFRFMLPSKGYPRDKQAVIGQIFDMGGCKSWAGTLRVANNELWFDHRRACIAPTATRLAADIPRDKWVSIVIHFVASQANAGGIEIWYNGAKKAQPSYRVKNINFAFGKYTANDRLVTMPMNTIGLKFGMYNYDASHYTQGETRVIYYDDVSQLIGNPADAFERVNPK